MSRPRSGLALRHRVATGAPQGRPQPERFPSSRSGRRVQGSALAAGGTNIDRNWDDAGLAVARSRRTSWRTFRVTSRTVLISPCHSCTR